MATQTFLFIISAQCAQILSVDWCQSAFECVTQTKLYRSDAVTCWNEDEEGRVSLLHIEASDC